MINTLQVVGICGASDCFPDPEWPGVSWMEKLENLLPENYIVKNFALEGASNFLINLQVEQAIESCDIILVNFSSSVRFEYCIKEPQKPLPLLDRFFQFYRSNNAENLWSLVSTSPLSIHKNPILNKKQQHTIKNFYTEFHDMQLDVKKNFIFIKYTINELIRSQKKFIFSTGGFEHESYMNVESEYLCAFDEYQRWQSKYNLWDYITDFKSARPYFHITDHEITTKISEYYKNFIVN